MNYIMKKLFVSLFVISLLVVEDLSANTLTADNSLIVDCLLPGKVRQLGINRSYVSRKTPTKTSANDCEIKGGDYVKFCLLYTSDAADE